jgi:hypothetical protein
MRNAPKARRRASRCSDFLPIHRPNPETNNWLPDSVASSVTVPSSGSRISVSPSSGNMSCSGGGGSYEEVIQLN